MIDKKYRVEALKIKREDISELPKTVAWESPSNIAFIKYWGKKGDQIPINPSFSMTLSNLTTRTEIHYRRTTSEKGKVHFRFENDDNHPFGERVKNYLKKIEVYFPFLEHLDLHIESRNNFPHSSGLASSASAFSSIALGICSIEDNLRKEQYSPERFSQKASYMSRLGSGSASRSVYGNFVEWGEHDYGSDEFAHPFSHRIHQTFETLNDSVLITSSGKKQVSSSRGHKLMDTHPYKESRIEQALNNMERIRIAIKEGDFNKFAEVLENEALSLHALMLSSEPGFILFNQHTIEIINKIRNYRKNKNVPVTFTLDAGPNVHVIYPIQVKESVREFINSELLEYCEEGKVFHDFTGNGPEKINKDV